ncbi:hypothetical protein OIU79_017063 [Salix purpurea]|uniref:Uncharacterized protein n=1 Tax=Salix purpurea TaxID=77065 RepID=A0A9Q1AJL6_SALPP|nr:hypothetical protein OIU79_017063 [Salix purpurea]
MKGNGTVTDLPISDQFCNGDNEWLGLYGACSVDLFMGFHCCCDYGFQTLELKKAQVGAFPIAPSPSSSSQFPDVLGEEAVPISGICLQKRCSRTLFTEQMLHFLDHAHFNLFVV